MKYSIETYKDNIALINVDNEKGLKATLVSFGAGVYELSFNDHPVILTLKEIDDYLYSSQYYGKTLGTVAGRLKKDGLIDGNEYHLIPESGQNLLCMAECLNQSLIRIGIIKSKRAIKS